ncbi:MAG: 50S ribosomal protein L25, partial [Chloroflexi bacterium]|nr:50S ribosomal protein L25 [Chloroflexota bacterium]
VSIGGETYSSLLRVLQRHPVTRQPLHVEFYRVDANRPIQTQVQLHLVGDAPAARLPAAMISQLLHDITVECLPANIPHAINVDISSLIEIGATIVVSDLKALAGVVFVAEMDQVIVRAAVGRVAGDGTATGADAGASTEDAN